VKYLCGSVYKCLHRSPDQKSTSNITKFITSSVQHRFLPRYANFLSKVGHKEKVRAAILTLSNGDVLGSHPPVNDHRRVMVDVQKCHLAVLLSQNEKHLTTFTLEFERSSRKCPRGWSENFVFLDRPGPSQQKNRQVQNRELDRFEA